MTTPFREGLAACAACGHPRSDHPSGGGCAALHFPLHASRTTPARRCSCTAFRALDPKGITAKSLVGAILDRDLLRVLIVDDSEIAREVVSELFEAIGAEVHTLASAIGLSGALRRLQPDAVILDVNMPAIRGDEAVAKVRELCPAAAVALFSDDPKCGEYARIAGAAWVGKSEPHRLLPAVMRSLAAAAARGKP